MALVNQSTDNIIVFKECIEKIILDIGDAFDIRVVWDKDTAVLTGAFALAGGLVGGYAGGRMGAALGAGIGGATGLGVATIVNLRDIWSAIKSKLEELYYIVFNYLRRLDPVDIALACDILMACTRTRMEVACAVLDLITQKLGRQVISSIAA